MLKWLSAEVKIRNFSRRDGSRSPSFSGSSFSPSTAWFRASRRAWKLDWLPPEVNTPSAESPSPSCPAAHVDEPALDHGGARALVPGVHRGVHRGQDGLGHEGRDHDGAVQVRRVLGVVEVDGVPEVDALQLVKGSCGIRQRGAEVHAVDAALQLGGRGPGEGPGALGDFVGHCHDTLEHLGRVSVGIPGVEEVGGGIVQQLCRRTGSGLGAGRQGVKIRGDDGRHREILCLT